MAAESFIISDVSPSTDNDDVDSLPSISSGVLSSDGESDAQREWEASLEQIQLLLTMVLIPFVGKYFGRKFAYWSESYLQGHPYASAGLTISCRLGSVYAMGTQCRGQMDEQESLQGGRGCGSCGDIMRKHRRAVLSRYRGAPVHSSALIIPRAWGEYIQHTVKQAVETGHFTNGSKKGQRVIMFYIPNAASDVQNTAGHSGPNPSSLPSSSEDISLEPELRHHCPCRPVVCLSPDPHSPVQEHYNPIPDIHPQPAALGRPPQPQPVSGFRDLMRSVP